MAEKILIIDDDANTTQVIHLLFSLQGYEVISALSAGDGLRGAYRNQPDLVLLDIMMPDMDGWEVCRRLRAVSDVPIVFLSARSEVSNVVRGLETGADDYIVKPYHQDELVARVRACLRRRPRSTTTEDLLFNDGNFRISLAKHEAYLYGAVIPLAPKEFDLLSALACNAGRAITHSELVSQAWKTQESQTMDILKLYIHYLRRKIERDPRHPEYILSVRGIGYRFVER